MYVRYSPGFFVIGGQSPPRHCKIIISTSSNFELPPKVRPKKLAKEGQSKF